MLPAELKEKRNWVVCKGEFKLPFNPLTRDCASVMDSSTWVDFQTAKLSVLSGQYQYLGYVFDGDGLIGIDIDKGFNEDGSLSELSKDVVTKCRSYTELSKSGKGFHILVKGKLPFTGRNNRKGLEIYRQSRFFIMTGRTVKGFRDIVENQSAIDEIVSTYFALEEEAGEQKPSLTGYTPRLGTVPKSKHLVSLQTRYPEIEKGSRHLTLVSLAGRLYNQHFTAQQLYDELQRANQQACKPPLPDHEVMAIVRSMGRYKR